MTNGSTGARRRIHRKRRDLPQGAKGPVWSAATLVSGGFIRADGYAEFADALVNGPNVVAGGTIGGPLIEDPVLVSLRRTSRA